GATATMTATSGGSTTTLTNSSGGTYTKAHLVPGTYTLTVTAPGYAAMTTQTGIVIAAGVSHADLAGTVTATPGSITGTVTDSLTSLPLSGVTVTANFSGTTARTATTNGSGVYTINGLEPATWLVGYTLTNYGPLNTSVGVTRAAASTANAVLVQLGERVDGLTYGYATDPLVITSSTDNPQALLAGVNVEITGGAPGFTATSMVTGADGAYSFGDIKAGSYTITFTHDKYKTVARSLTTVVAGHSNSSDSLIAHSGTATVTVKDLELGATPGLVSTASIQLAGVRLASPRTGTSAADGTVTFSSVPPGSYTVSLVTPPSGYLASAATVPLTMGLSSGIDATVLLGSGTAAADYPISKAVSLDVTVSGLVNGDTASIAVTWPGGTATPQVVGNSIAHFTGLPPGQPFTVQGTKANYTGGAGSSVAVTLGGLGTATAVMVPVKAHVEVLVTGLLGTDTTTVTLDGVTSPTPLHAGDSYTFTNVTPGIFQALTFSNTDYTGTPSNVGTPLAGADLTGANKITLALTPKAGSLNVTVNGLFTTDTAHVTVEWSGGSSEADTASGVAHVTGIKAGEPLTIKVNSPTNYTGGADVPVAALLANQQDRAEATSVTHHTATLTVTVAGIDDIGHPTDVANIVISYAGGPNITRNGVGNGPAAPFTVPAGILLTITVSPGTPYAGATTTPDSTTTTIVSGGSDSKTLTLT
ncbi:MAG: putative invasin, partial [Actinomycetia bacterium]|nr:putative invasin [Actinomycetes bacterium]